MAEEKIIVQLRGFDAKHYRTTERYAKQVERLYDTAVQEMATAASGLTLGEDETFTFDRYPKAKKQAQGIVTRLAQRIEAVTSQGVKAEWEAACHKNDAFVGSIIRTSKLTKEEAEQYNSRNLEALSTFQQRKVGGLNLSQRVWKYVGDFRDAMELGIDIGLGEGRSAAELSRDLRQYLREPDRLYRRVRDKGGNLRLSKAAKMYHSGQGVYRSSYKNAMRLARTEINMAYREAEYQRWQQLDFVVGFRIHLSNNHTILNSKGEPVPFHDICDELAGDYPKTFKFVGWHPQCRCFVTPILSDYDEYNKNRANRLKAIVRKQQYKALPSRRTVTDVPPTFRKYIEGIEERAKGWKSQPYYIRDNFKGGVIGGGLNGRIPTKTMNTVQPCTEFDTRISSLKRWAYAFGLNVSGLDALRNAGNRLGLLTEIEQLEALSERRQNEWLDSVNELYAVKQQAKAENYNDIADKCTGIIAANRCEANKYYGDCIARLKQAVTDMLAELKAAITKRKAKAKDYSKFTPDELKLGNVYLNGEDYVFSKEFFDMLKSPVRLEIRHTNKGSYEQGGNLVVIDSDNRNKASNWHKKSVIYHEYGHAIADQRGLIYDSRVTKLRDEQIKRLRKKVDYYEYVPTYDSSTGKWVDVKQKTRGMYAKALSERMNRVLRKLRSMPDSVFTSRGITKDDVVEQFCATQDALKSLIISVGYGHTTAYFKQYSHKEHEYLAHCFENAFIGNVVFRHFMPTEYAEMVALVKGLKF